MNARTTLAYRKLLSDLAKRLDSSLAHDQCEVMRMELSDLPGGPLAATDETLDSGMQEIEIGLIANEQSLLAEVNAALARIDAGTFGNCATCGKAISKSRLDAVPYALRCARCAKVAEKTPATK